VAGGRLVKFEGSLERKDELGALVASFQTMSSGLSDTVREVRSAFHRVEEGLQTMRKHLGATVENTREQASASTQVDENVRAIQEAANEVGHLMEGLSALAEEVSSSVLEMIASIDEIAANTGGLNEAVNTSASTLTENVAANRQIDGSTERLNRFVEDTSVAMTEMEGSIRQIEENAGRTRQAAQTVAEEAAAGMKAIEQSQQSIEKLQESFAATSTVMKRLGVRSREVGNILSVIDEVMEQTHLLALNAAIIAAQAGDHGKPFAVVAGEIKDLAAKTSESTREISAIIDAVQREVQEAVGAAGDQSTLVDDTVIHAKEVSRVFVGIREAVRPTLEMVQEIARATAEQAKGAASIVHSTEQLRDLSHQLRQATKEQAVGSEQILDAVNRIRVLSEEMRRATSEQSAGSALIRQAMDHLTAAVSKVLVQNQAQSRAVKSVQQTMDLFTGKNKATLQNIGEVGEQVDALSRRTEEAASALARFRIEDH
jgi:methyl-accepting chemotaxis protein